MVVYATFARRTWALALNVLLDLLVYAALNALIPSNEWLTLTFVAWLGIHHVGLVTEGGTLGQRLAGLRVVHTDGTRVTVGRAFVRLFILVCAALPPLGLGVLWMLDDEQRRGWHDITAKTVVVRESGAAVPAAPVWAASPPWKRAAAPD